MMSIIELYYRSTNKVKKFKGKIGIDNDTDVRWSRMDLVFERASSEKQVKEVFEHTTDAFSDSPDFSWTLSEIKNEVKEGWELFACKVEVDAQIEVIAAVFMKEEDDSLLTKNTAIKMHQQGSGYSHQIKAFFEQTARERGLKQIKHYCRIDNFRMYSLNESHGYEKTGDALGEDGQVVEWTKVLKKNLKS